MVANVPGESAAREGAGQQPAGHAAGALPHRRVTANMLVSYNLAHFRKAAGLTQKQLGAALGGWSEASVSVAERGWDGRRIRKFDADEITRIAVVLGIPAFALLLPPEDAGTAVDYLFDVGADRLIVLEGILREVLPAYEGDTPAMAAFRERVLALGTTGFAEPGITEARQIVADARARAESLDRDAQERHRQAMRDLLPQHEALQRRVDDLRAFEREYRLRLLALVEEQARQLRADADDPSTPAGGDHAAEDGAA
jgi:transcriptional regulator with XRE-family HTH domain